MFALDFDANYKWGRMLTTQPGKPDQINNCVLDEAGKVIIYLKEGKREISIVEVDSK